MLYPGKAVAAVVEIHTREILMIAADARNALAALLAGMSLVASRCSLSAPVTNGPIAQLQ